MRLVGSMLLLSALSAILCGHRGFGRKTCKSMAMWRDGSTTEQTSSFCGWRTTDGASLW
ncbi:unnamed protein product, partial [Symbiodinium microadriaticum]